MGIALVARMLYNGISGLGNGPIPQEIGTMEQTEQNQDNSTAMPTTATALEALCTELRGGPTPQSEVWWFVATQRATAEAESHSHKDRAHALLAGTPPMSEAVVAEWLAEQADWHGEEATALAILRDEIRTHWDV